MMARPSVLLPDPLSPTRAKRGAGRDGEGDVEHRIEEAILETGSGAP